MGNLEKAGVLVVVALLAVILVVAFLNYPEPTSGGAPSLDAKAPRLASAASDVVKPPVTPPVSRPDSGDVLPRGPQEAPSGGDRATTPQEPVAKKPVPTDEGRDVVPGGGSTPPTTPPPADEHAPSEMKKVKIQPKDSIWTIAVREYGPKVGPKMLKAILAANPTIRADALRANTEISLPAAPADAAPIVAKESDDHSRGAVTRPSTNTNAKSKSSLAAAKPKPKATAASRRLPFVPVN